MSTPITVTLQLSAEQAAAMLRFAEKSGHHEALQVLYAHIPQPVRDEQASQVCQALSVLERALSDAGARAWPWVETGRA